MKHKEITIKLEDYREGACSTSEAREIELHLKKCARCREKLEDARRVGEIFGRLTRGKVSAGYDARFAEKLKTVQPRKPHREMSLRFISLRPRWVPALATAAGILFVAGLAITTAWIRNDRLPRITSVSGAVSVYRSGEGRWVEASIGQRIGPEDRIITRAGAMIDIASAGQYRCRCLGETRIASAGRTPGGWLNSFRLEDGSALFLIDHNFIDAGFEVNTPSALVVATGTGFKIQVDPTGGSKVEVITGTVTLRSYYRGNRPEAMVTVSKGKTASVSPFDFPAAPEPLTVEEQARLEEEFRELEKAEKAGIPSMKEVEGEARIELIIPPGPGRVRAFLKGASLIYSEDLSDSLLVPLRKAHTLCREGKTGEGIRALEEIIEQTPGGEYNPELLLFIAALYHSILDQPENALPYLIRVILEGKSKWNSLARCARGIIMDEAGQRYRKEASRILKSVAREYPGTPEGDEARTALSEQEDGN